MPLTEAIKAGDKLLIAVAAKTVSATTDDGKALVGIRIQENRAPFAGFAENRFKVGSNWQLIQIRTTAAADLPAGHRHDRAPLRRRGADGRSRAGLCSQGAGDTALRDRVDQLPLTTLRPDDRRR